MIDDIHVYLETNYPALTNRLGYELILHEWRADVDLSVACERALVRLREEVGEMYRQLGIKDKKGLEMETVE